MDVLDKITEDKKGAKVKWGIIVSVAVVAVLICLGIYNSPAGQLGRLLDLGQKYLKDQNYEQAIIAFKQAIEIDEKCIEAYAGGIEAYVQNGISMVNTEANMEESTKENVVASAEEIQTFHEKALETVKSLNSNELDKKKVYVSAIYKFVDKIYDDWYKIISILEEGLNIIGNDPEIEKKLIESYLNLVKEQMEAGNYEEAKTLVEKYKRYELEIDSTELLERIESLEKRSAESIVFLSGVYELMEKNEYSSLSDYQYKRDVATPFVQGMETDRCIYVPNSTNGSNGKGVGVYKFGVENDNNPAYYFYYGDYENNMRKGEGISFYNYGDSMTIVFIGNWDNDAPNGIGYEITYGPNDDVEVYGNLVDGLWDGKVATEIDAWFDGEKYSMTFTASNGQPVEDKTPEYLSLYPPASESTSNGGGVIVKAGSYDRGLDYEALGEDEYIYAYDQKRYLGTEKNSKLGVIGYGTQWEKWEYGSP